LNRPAFASLLVLLNAIPLAGVWWWDWRSFDLIFLYWLENVFIGFFSLLRFMLRRYSQPVELFGSLGTCAFFSFHYGMFCMVHGMFVLNLFGDELPQAIRSMNPYFAAWPVAVGQGLQLAAAALLLYQLADWLRDTFERGLVGMDLQVLMLAPYRRIVVLHITLIGSGFLLAAMQEPIGGLFLLVILKTGFDLYHWHRDEQQIETPDASVLVERVRQHVDPLINDPQVIINNRRVTFADFETFQKSGYYRILKWLMLLEGGRPQLMTMEKYIAGRLAADDGGRKRHLP
jgi:hypothetical protein